MDDRRKLSYHEKCIEELYKAVRDGTAPFLPKENELKTAGNKITLAPRPVVRSAPSGKVFKGINQLVAQIELEKMHRKDTAVITFEQAKKMGSAIRKGEKSFTLTSYDKNAPAGARLTVYHVFPASAVASPSKELNDKLLQIRNRSQKQKTGAAIECHDSSPEKFLGAYLAAASCGAVIRTDRQTVESFQKEFTAYLASNIKRHTHSKAFDIGKAASETCKTFLRETYQARRERLPAASRKSPAPTMTNDLEISR